jgi:hypothetical protein
MQTEQVHKEAALRLSGRMRQFLPPMQTGRPARPSTLTQIPFAHTVNRMLTADSDPQDNGGDGSCVNQE